MADTFDTLSEKYNKLVSESAIANWNEDNLTEFLQQNITVHRQIADTLRTLSSKEMMDWVQGPVRAGLNTLTSRAKDVFDNYRRYLKGTAQNEERLRPLGSLAKANEIYASLLSSVLKKLGQLLGDEKAVELQSIRLSQLSILGLLKQSDTVLNFSSYLYTFMVNIASGTADALPKYREMYLLEKYADVSVIVSDLLDKRGAYTFLAAVEEARRKQHDLVMGFDWTAASAPFRAMKAFWDASGTGTKAVLGALAATAVAYFAVKHGPVLFDDYRLSRHKKNVESKQWLEAHTALLRMQLTGLDPSDPKYAKLQSIIRAYDTKLAEYDQKINTFESEEG